MYSLHVANFKLCTSTATAAGGQNFLLGFIFTNGAFSTWTFVITVILFEVHMKSIIYTENQRMKSDYITCQSIPISINLLHLHICE